MVGPCHRLPRRCSMPPNRLNRARISDRTKNNSRRGPRYIDATPRIRWKHYWKGKTSIPTDLIVRWQVTEQTHSLLGSQSSQRFNRFAESSARRVGRDRWLGKSLDGCVWHIYQSMVETTKNLVVGRVDPIGAKARELPWRSVWQDCQS